MSKITGVLIDVQKKTAVVHTMQSGALEEYYDILNCTTFDIASRKIGKNYYDIYCDDEGLLKINPIVSAVSPDRSPMLVGNLFVTKTDVEGETISLTEKELFEVITNTIQLIDSETMTPYIALVCDY